MKGGETGQRDCGALRLRPAAVADLDAINTIYNHYVLHSTCTYQETPEPMEARREWFARHDTAHPVIVAELAGRVVGWGALSAYHARSAYRHTVEDSVYVAEGYHRRGIGTALLGRLVAVADGVGHHAILAVIDGEQAPSIALHARFGFQEVGLFREIGYKFDRWLDVVYLQRLLNSAGQAARRSACAAP